MKLEWVTTAGNRYEVPVAVNEETLKTEPFGIDPKLGVGHLELDGEAIGPDFEPGAEPIVVNFRMILLAQGKLPVSPDEEPPPEED